MPEDIKERISDAKESVSQAVNAARERTDEVMHNVTNKIEDTRDAAAGAVHSASESLHAKAENLPGGRPVTNLAHSAADRIDSAAGYMAEHDTGEMMGDIGSLLRRHPGKSLLVAAAFGFFIGRAIGRD